MEEAILLKHLKAPNKNWRAREETGERVQTVTGIQKFANSV